MPQPNEPPGERTVRGPWLKTWEFNVLLLESILLGALLCVGVWWVLNRVAELPEPVALGLGFLILGWTVFPVLRCHGRWTGRPLHGFRFAIGTTVGAALGGLIYWWIRL